MATAIAAECAGAVGAFESFHDAAFAQQDSLGLHSFAELAAESGVRDTTLFGHCLNTAAPRERVLRDMRLGKQLGITGTPTLIINGMWYPQSPAKEELERIVRVGH